MTVTDVRKDPANHTLVMTARFEAPVERVWQVWADPRQLEYPATVMTHDFRPGGRVTYYMTGPTGDRHYGWWLINAVGAPNRLDFDDGFADENGAPVQDGPPVTSTLVTLAAPASATTEMVVTSTFPSEEAMEQLLAMGMEEGLKLAVGQIDAILAGTTARSG